MPKKIKVLNQWLLLMAVGVLASCVKKNNIVEKKPMYHSKAVVLQAKHSDIPTPLGCTLENTKEEPNSTNIFVVECLSMTSKLNSKQVRSFYLEELINHGWDINDFSTRNNTLLMCEKPHKECIISSIENVSKQCCDTSKIQVLIKSKKPADNIPYNVASH